MLSQKEVYFQFRANIQKTKDRPIYLKDIIELACPQEIRDEVLNIEVRSSEKSGSMVISAIQVIELIQTRIKDVSVFLVGEGKALIESKRPDKSNKLLIYVKLAFSVILLFFGAALAIMYFHADVNMHHVHQMIYKIITGKKETRPLILSIPYSLGIGLGIALFFGLFTIGKKKQNPGPLELEIYRYEKDMYSYIRDEEEKEED